VISKPVNLGAKAGLIEIELGFDLLFKYDEDTEGEDAGAVKSL
jgi:hypothetical protein